MFGKHLVNRGLLREEALPEALEKQDKMTIALGRLAHQLGLVTLDQVMEVLHAQKASPLRSGNPRR